IEETRPPPDNEVGARLSAAGQELRNLSRKVLTVSVKRDDGVISVFQRVHEARLQRRPLPSILRMAQHMRTGSRRCASRRVRGSIVDHQNIGRDGFALAHDARDCPNRVECRNEDEHPLGHSASLESTAQTMPPPAEIELTSTCRSSRRQLSPVGTKRIASSPAVNPTEPCRVCVSTAI